MSHITKSGKAALLVGHCAGMVDMVGLPIWVGTLIGWYKLDPQLAGLLVSCFLGGQVISSIVLAPLVTRIPAVAVAVGGFAVAGLSFLGVSQFTDYPTMLALHLVGGLGAGCSLSVTHGMIGRSANPHRLFATAGFALSVFGLLLLGGGTKLVAVQGGAALFLLFAGVMLLAVLAALAAFPQGNAGAGGERSAPSSLLPQVWFGMAGMAVFAIGQAAIFSFVQRIGLDRGYGVDTVSAALATVGIVALCPAPLAGWLQHRLRAEQVIVAGPVLHAAVAVSVTHTESVALYVLLISLLLAATLFIHIFLFGLLARLDPTGRAVAATPAMLMIGAAIGPMLGGTAVKFAGYPALGITVACIGAVAAALFLGARRRAVPVPASGQLA
jgi:predicted MFS family arabinose efflux permease